MAQPKQNKKQKFPARADFIYLVSKWFYRKTDVSLNPWRSNAPIIKLQRMINNIKRSSINEILNKNLEYSKPPHTIFTLPSKWRTKPRKKKMWVPEKGVQSRKITKTIPWFRWLQKSHRVSSTIHIYVFHICGFNQLQIKHIWKKKTSKKHNLNSTYTVFTTIYVVFTMY